MYKIIYKQKDLKTKNYYDLRKLYIFLIKHICGKDSIISKQQNTKIDRDKFIIQLSGTDIILPKKEFELLELLANRPGKVYTRDQILKVVWGDEAIVGERTIDVHIRKLREKIGNDYIRTIKGVGYTFTEK